MRGLAGSYKIAGKIEEAIVSAARACKFDPNRVGAGEINGTLTFVFDPAIRPWRARGRLLQTRASERRAMFIAAWIPDAKEATWRTIAQFSRRSLAIFLPTTIG
ncbi:MAG TPA: hypothetical protein VFV34_29210 [Blastocatellia bacterium]|nr:hypothetical protein [Blastocatellia bacterium]